MRPSLLYPFHREIEACVRCGLCTAVCPLYRILRREPAVARGRMAQAQELFRGRGLSWKGIAKDLGLCLTCNLCGEHCPTGVRGGVLTLALRAEAARQGALPWGKRFLLRLVTQRRGLLGFLLRALWILQKAIPTEKPPLRHLPHLVEGLVLGPRIPKPAPRSLRALLPQRVPARGERSLKVVLFAGCAVEYLFPSLGLRASVILAQRGVEILYPKGQVCCGMPLFGKGDLEGARRLARKNIEALLADNPDHCLTLCASCASALKGLYPQLLGEGEELARKTKDLSELLLDLLPPSPQPLSTPLPPGTRVTYHDPCHLLHHQGITQQPRAILKALPGIEFVEHEGRGQCCGLGGSFSLEHPRLSEQIGQRKLLSIEKSKADIVVTSCPGCMIQLMTQAKRQKLPIKVLHLVEVLEDVDYEEQSAIMSQR